MPQKGFIPIVIGSLGLSALVLTGCPILTEHQQPIHIAQKPGDPANYNRRIFSIVLHFTNIPVQDSLDLLRKGGVNAHFLIPKQARQGVDGWQLVNIKDRARHAGRGAWQGRTELNDTSIGIEQVNYGFGFRQPNGSVLYYHNTEEKVRAHLIQALHQGKTLLTVLQREGLLDAFLRDMLRGVMLNRDKARYLKTIPQSTRDRYRKLTQQIGKDLPSPFTLDLSPDQLYSLEKSGKLVWDAFTPHQLDTLTVLLKRLIQETTLKGKDGTVWYSISPTAIVAHSDISPGRIFHMDPGPCFPWRELAVRGIGAWPDEQEVRAIRNQLERAGQTSLRAVDIGWLQDNLQRYGYTLSTSHKLDTQTKNVLVSFQMHFRPANYAGKPDIETAAILGALIKKYFPESYTPPVLTPKDIP